MKSANLMFFNQSSFVGMPKHRKTRRQLSGFGCMALCSVFSSL